MWWQRYYSASHAERIRLIRERTEEERELWNLSYVQQQRASNAVPPAYKPAAQAPSLPQPPRSALPPPAVGQALDSRKIDAIATEICIRLGRVPPGEREATFQRVQAGIRQQFPTLVASEIIRKTQEKIALIR